jgi:hypothetical protein
MDRIPTGHRSPAFSGPAWVGPFSSRRGCNKIWRKAVQIGTPGLAFAGRWNEGLSGPKCDIYSAGCRKTSQALSTKAAAAFTSRAQATQAKKCSSYSSRNTGESSPRIYFSAACMRTASLWSIASCRWACSIDFTRVLRSASQVPAHRTEVHSSQGPPAISSLGILPRSGRPHRQARPRVTGVSGFPGSVCNTPRMDARYQTASTFAPGLHALS